MKEALRCLENAKEMLETVQVEDNTYTDVKPVQEACGAAYLAVLKAIDQYLIKKGVGQKELPQSVDGYREMMRKHLTIHNGKLLKEFAKLIGVTPYSPSDCISVRRRSSQTEDH